MNPREHIQAAPAHRPVDRVPVDLGGARQGGIVAPFDAALRFFP